MNTSRIFILAIAFSLCAIAVAEEQLRKPNLRGVGFHRRVQNGLPKALKKCIKRCIREKGKKKGKCKKRCNKQLEGSDLDGTDDTNETAGGTPPKTGEGEDVFIPDVSRDPPKGNGKWVELENGVTFKISIPKEFGTTDDCIPEDESRFGRYPCVVPFERRNRAGLDVGRICVDSNDCETGCCMPTRVGAQVTPDTPFENSQLCLYQETVPHIPCVYDVDPEDAVIDSRGEGPLPLLATCTASSQCESECCFRNTETEGECVGGVPESLRSQRCMEDANALPSLTPNGSACADSSECESDCCLPVLNVCVGSSPGSTTWDRCMRNP